MVAQTLEIEEPHLVFGKLGRVAPLILFPDLSGSSLLMDVGTLPFLVRGNIAKGAHGPVTGTVVFGGLKNGLAAELTVPPHLAVGVFRFEHCKKFGVPIVWITAVRFAFHVVPPHVFLTLGEGPGGLASHGAGLTRDTSIDVKDEGKLSVRMSFFVRKTHPPSELPVVDFSHSPNLLSESNRFLSVARGIVCIHQNGADSGFLIRRGLTHLKMKNSTPL